MSIFETIASVRAITAAFRAKDWLLAAQLTATFIGRLLGGEKPQMAAATPEQHAELKAAIAEMNDCCCAFSAPTP